MESHIMDSRTTYSLVEFVFSLYLFSRYQILGRYRLAQELGLSRDQTRTILRHLVERKLIEKVSQRQGHQLSSIGKKLVVQFKKYMEIPPVRIYLGSDYTIGTKDAVVCVEAAEIDQINTVVLRDEALLAGSLGCTVFLQNSEKSLFLLNATYPPLPDTPIKVRKVKKKISRVTEDIAWDMILIIIGTADSSIAALRGAIAAGALLLPDYLKEPLFTR
jgi:hypothetical protein